MHFFTFFPLLGDTGRYEPRFVVYIVPRRTKNRNHYDTETNHQNHHLGAHRGTDCPGRSLRAHVLQRSTDRNQPVGVLPTGRHIRHDSDQDHRIVRREEKPRILMSYFSRGHHGVISGSSRGQFDKSNIFT